MIVMIPVVKMLMWSCIYVDYVDDHHVDGDGDDEGDDGDVDDDDGDDNDNEGEHNGSDGGYGGCDGADEWERRSYCEHRFFGRCYYYYTRD